MLSPLSVAAAVIIQRDQVLVTRRAPGQKMAGVWEFPGGKLESGENAATCIVRELAEELGVVAEAGEVLATNLHHYPGGAIELIGIQVRVASDDWKLTVHDEVRWVGAADLLSLDLAPADGPIAEAVCALLVRPVAVME